jgi:transposase-like protein
MGIAELIKRETGMDAPERSEGERSEPSRSGGASIPVAAAASKDSGVANPEVNSKAVRRRFSATYKRRILQEADQCGPGGIAALLRRQGLYSSHLTTWRKLRETGEIAGLEPRKRGKKPVPRNPLAAENERLRRETQRLQKRLRQAETIIDVQKKLCDLLGLTVPPIEQNGSDE